MQSAEEVPPSTILTQIRPWRLRTQGLGRSFDIKRRENLASRPDTRNAALSNGLEVDLVRRDATA
jgi:hypothetical protein